MADVKTTEEKPRCSVCRREYQHHHDMADTCSEYCLTTTVKQRKEYEAVRGQPRAFCIYPCANCGRAIEDELNENGEEGFCSPCAPKVRLAEAMRLLRRCYVTSSKLPLPAELRNDIKVFLGEKDG